MKPSKVKKALLTCIQARQPVFIEGSPGTAKSAIIEMLPETLDELLDKPGWEHYKKHATKAGWQMVDIRASYYDPADLMGLPIPDQVKKLTEWLTPSMWPREGVGIIFMDELTHAVPTTQGALYQIIHDRRLADYEMPPGWITLAAGNKTSDRALVYELNSALANRFIHMTMDVDAEDWFDWAPKNNIHPDILAFHRFRQIQGENSLLYNFDPTNDEKAWPSLRTWEFTSNLMWCEPPKDVEFDLYAGTVGEAAARELIGFLAVRRDLPDLEMIEKHPETTMLPKEPSAFVAVAMALVNRATVFNNDAVGTYMNRTPPEYCVLFWKSMKAKDPALLQCDAFVKWSGDDKNKGLFRAA